MGVNKEKIRVLVTGAFGNGNFGDDALIHACQNLVSGVIPREEVAFQAIQSNYLQQLFPNLHFVDSVNDLPNLKWILYGGGTQFSSFENSYDSKTMQLKRGLIKLISDPKSLFKRLREVSKSSKTKYAGIGLGIGPFHKYGSDEADARRMVQKMQFLSIRDDLSCELCKSWKIDCVTQGADLCFLPNLFEGDKVAELVEVNNFKQLAIIPRDWNHSALGEAYVAKLQAGYLELAKLGVNITFVCFSKKGDAQWINWLVNNDIPHIVWNPLECSINHFYKKLNRYDIFVTARYHGAVFAKLNNKPFVAIDIEPKLRQIGRLFEEDAQIWSSPFDISNLVDLIQTIMVNAALKKCDQDGALQRQRLLALDQKKAFCLFIKKNLV